MLKKRTSNTTGRSLESDHARMEETKTLIEELNKISPDNPQQRIESNRVDSEEELTGPNTNSGKTTEEKPGAARD